MQGEGAKRTRSGFEFLCLTPGGLPDPAIAIAASRAGACGVLDLELVASLDEARAALATLARLARRPCGVKLDGRRPEFAHTLLATLPAEVRTVLITPGGDEANAGLVAAARARGARVLGEATSAEEATRMVAAGVDGLVAKGHEAAGRVGEETTFVLLQRLVSGP
ncbi:MAG TPA: hypothetical protein VMQ62_15340, partial [Dongiaceae bacterium]|nr:hypothetical protein [Dongiaceae bacterium]